MDGCGEQCGCSGGHGVGVVVVEWFDRCEWFGFWLVVWSVVVYASGSGRGWWFFAGVDVDADCGGVGQSAIESLDLCDIDASS